MQLELESTKLVAVSYVYKIVSFLQFLKILIRGYGKPHPSVHNSGVRNPNTPVSSMLCPLVPTALPERLEKFNIVIITQVDEQSPSIRNGQPDSVIAPSDLASAPPSELLR